MTVRTVFTMGAYTTSVTGSAGADLRKTVKTASSCIAGTLTHQRDIIYVVRHSDAVKTNGVSSVREQHITFRPKL